MVYYDVNGQRFANPYAAFLHGAANAPHVFPKFDFYDVEFSLIDWTHEPVESFESLCDQRAHQLRDKYQWLVLAFTGGTDSITIYNTFVRNRIHIDEIYIGIGWPSDGGDDKFLQCEKALLWIQKNHPDPSTKITFHKHQTLDALQASQSRFLSPYWLAETTESTHFKYHRSPLEFLYQTLPDHHQSYCIITGFEKPTLIQHDQKIYFAFLDRTFSIVMMRPDVEFFYVTPDLPALHAKQCHMLINQSQKLKISLEQLQRIEHYYLRSAFLGRDQELYHSISQLEKIILADYKKTLMSIDFSRPNSVAITESFRKNPNLFTLASAIENKSRYWNCYAENWAILQTHTTLIDYLVNHKILTTSSQALYGYNNIFSKMHRLK